MVSGLKFNIAKLSGKVVTQLSKVGPGGGKNIPGYAFDRIGGHESISELAKDLKIGSVLITGTNGKTTTTTLFIKLMTGGIEFRKSFENNTINQHTLGALEKK